MSRSRIIALAETKSSTAAKVVCRNRSPCDRDANTHHDWLACYRLSQQKDRANLHPTFVCSCSGSTKWRLWSLENFPMQASISDI